MDVVDGVIEGRQIYGYEGRVAAMLWRQVEVRMVRDNIETSDLRDFGRIDGRIRITL